MRTDKCPHICSNKTPLGYCKSTACINPKHTQKTFNVGLTAEYVQVVHCKDCRKHTDEEPGMVYCPFIVGGWCDDDWFCKSGERREVNKDV